jgi:hypothetical protein
MFLAPASPAPSGRPSFTLSRSGSSASNSSRRGSRRGSMKDRIREAINIVRMDGDERSQWAKGSKLDWDRETELMRREDWNSRPAAQKEHVSKRNSLLDPLDTSTTVSEAQRAAMLEEMKWKNTNNSAKHARDCEAARREGRPEPLAPELVCKTKRTSLV